MKGTKSEILAVARDLLLAQGLAGVSMRKVAAQVGVSATAIYRHYADKEELIADVVEEGHRIFSTYLMRSLSEATPRERLLAAGEGYLRFALEHEAYYRVMFMSRESLGAQECLQRRHEGPSPTFQFLVDRVAECQTGRLLAARREPMQVAVLLWSVCHGLAALHLAGQLDRLESREFWRYAKASLAQAIDAVIVSKAERPGRRRPFSAIS